MGLLGVLLLIFALYGITFGSKCIPETAKCRKFWVKIEPHRNLLESEAELDGWCRKQNQFYQCLENVLLADKNYNVSYLPRDLLISKVFAENLCTVGSTARTRYLNNAECINQLNTGICTEPEYLNIVTAEADPPNKCSRSEKTFSCIATTIVLNCGFDAGKVYRNLLTITKYSEEVCGIDTSQGIPPCEVEEPSDVQKDEEFPEIYDGLMHRMGSIPDQGNGEFPDTILNSIEEEESEDSKSVVVTEAMQILFDILDNNVVIEDDTKLTSSSMYESEEDIRPTEPKIDRKHPVITEVHNGVLFYNYTGTEFVTYFKLPEWTKIKGVTCQHLGLESSPPVLFACTIKYREDESECPASKTSEFQPLTPELIRVFDPDVPDDSDIEFGPRPNWMSYIDSLRELKRHRELMGENVNLILGPDKNDIVNEAFQLAWPEMQKIPEFPVKAYKIGKRTYHILFTHPDFKHIDSCTCSYLDKCNSKTREVFRCVIPTRNIGNNVDAEKLPLSMSSKKYEYDLEGSDSIEPEETENILDNSELTTEDLITLVFSGESEAFTDINEYHGPDMDELIYVNNVPEGMGDLSGTKVLEDETSVRLVILDQSATTTDAEVDGSEPIPELVYAINDVENFNQQTTEVTDNFESERNENYVSENISDNVETEYLIDSSGKMHRIGSISEDWQDDSGFSKDVHVDRSSELIISETIKAALDLLDDSTIYEE